MPLDPDPAAIAGLLPGRAAGHGHDRRARSTRSPIPGRRRLVEALVAGGAPVIAVALRARRSTSWPTRRVGTYACTYGIQPPNLRAMADALLGRIPFRGHLPVRLDAGLTGDHAYGASRCQLARSVFQGILPPFASTQSGASMTTTVAGPPSEGTMRLSASRSLR